VPSVSSAFPEHRGSFAYCVLRFCCALAAADVRSAAGVAPVVAAASAAAEAALVAQASNWSRLARDASFAHKARPINDFRY
jgi:hypothetical protein